MKTVVESSKGKRGSILITALVTTFVAGIVAAAVVGAAMQELRLSKHSAAREQAFHAAEAGVAEACEEFYKQWKKDEDGDLVYDTAWNDWEDLGDEKYQKTMSFNSSIDSSFSSEYNVVAYTDENEMCSTGTVIRSAFSKPITRKIKVEIRENTMGALLKGILTKGHINVQNGTVDSYDSEGLGTGVGDETTLTVLEDRSDEDIEANTTAIDPLMADLSLPVGADTEDWDVDDLGENNGVTYDASGDIPEVSVPDLSVQNNYVILQNGVLKTEQIITIPASERLDLSITSISLSKDIKIDGPGTCRIYVEGTTTLSGEITLGAGVKLEIYANDTVSIGGGGIINEGGKPADLFIFGTASCEKIAIAGSPTFVGVIYAPSASVTDNGGASIYGAVVGESVTFNGTGTNFHYDEALGRLDGAAPSGPVFFLVSWVEL